MLGDQVVPSCVVSFPHNDSDLEVGRLEVIIACITSLTRCDVRVALDIYNYFFLMCNFRIFKFSFLLQLDLKALGEKVESVAREAEGLASRFPERQEHVGEQRDEVVSSWRRLQEKASSKKSNLTQSEELQKFLNYFRDLL